MLGRLHGANINRVLHAYKHNHENSTGAKNRAADLSLCSSAFGETDLHPVDRTS